MKAAIARQSGVSAPTAPPSGSALSRPRMHPHGDIRGRVVESLLALTTATAIGQVANLLATLFLARLLAPADFGAIGVGTLVISAFTILRNAFVFQTLIHRADRVREAADQMVVLSGAMGAAFCILAWVGADGLGAFFHSPASATVLRLMACAFFINSVGVVPDTLFEKELRFRRKMWLESARPLITAACSVLLAIWGVGPASVGWGQVAAYAVWTVGLYKLSEYRPRPRWDPKLLRELLNYGRYVLGGALLIFFFTNLDNASIGRLLGARELGYYAFAFLLAYFPAQVITGGVVSSVLLPLYAKLQGRREEQSRSLQVTLRWVSYYAAPLCIGTLLLGPIALSVVYGHKWAPAYIPLQVLAIYGFAHTYFQVMRNLCNGVGRAREFWWISGLQLVIVIPLLIPAPLRFGIIGTSMLFTGAKIAATIVAFAYVAHLVGANASQLLRPIALPVSLSFLAALVAVLAAHVLRGPAGAHSWLAAMAEGSIFCVGYLLLCSLALRAHLVEVVVRLRISQPQTVGIRSVKGEEKQAILQHLDGHGRTRTIHYIMFALIIASASVILSSGLLPQCKPRRRVREWRAASSVRCGPDPRTACSTSEAVAGRQRSLPATVLLVARMKVIALIMLVVAPSATSAVARHIRADRAFQSREE